LERLRSIPGPDVLIAGIGTGLDLPLLPTDRRIVTRTDVVFEPALESAPGLAVRDDRGGWFRLIELEKT
jgi:hypothetical protein